MSTQTTPSKLATTIVFITGAYLFFITLVVTPYVNLTIFSSFHTITKVIMVASGAVIGGLQLFLLVPSIKRHTLQNIGKNLKIASVVSLVGILGSILFSSSIQTSLLGMFTTWENNIFMWTCYLLLLLSWTTYFLVLREYSLARTVFHTLLTLAVVAAIVYSIGEYYWWKPSTGYISQTVARISLGFKNPLFAAYFLGMLWSYTFAKAFTNFVHATPQKISAIRSLIYLALYTGITLALFLTFTRSAIIMAAITAAILVAWQLLKDAKAKSGYARTIVTAVIFASVAISLLFAYKKEFDLRNSDLTSESLGTLMTISSTLGKSTADDALAFYQNAKQYSSTEIRILEWKWGLRTWMGSIKNMLIGIGPDAGFFEMPKYRDPIFNNFPTDAATKPFYVRNLYINTLMELGIVTVFGLGYLLFHGLKKLLTTVSVDVAGVALIIGFLAQGVFYYPTQITTVLVLFACAYLISSYAPEKEGLVRTPNLQERLLLAILIIGIAIWGFILGKAEFIINTYGQAAIPPEASVMSKNALIPLNNNVLKRFYVYHYPEDVQAQKYLPEMAASKDLDDLRIAADAYYIIARKNNSVSDTQKSIDALTKQLSIDSTLPSAWDALGLRYLFIGNFTKAYASFTRALELKPDYWYSYMHLGEVTRQQCNPKAAIDWYKKAEQYIPTAENEIQEAQQEILSPRAGCK